MCIIGDLESEYFFKVMTDILCNYDKINGDVLKLFNPMLQQLFAYTLQTLNFVIELTTLQEKISVSDIVFTILHKILSVYCQIKEDGQELTEEVNYLFILTLQKKVS